MSMKNYVFKLSKKSNQREAGGGRGAVPDFFRTTNEIREGEGGRESTESRKNRGRCKSETF